MATNRVFESDRILSVTCSHPTTPASNGAVRWGTRIGVALNDEASDGTTVVDFGGVYDLSVKGVDDDGNAAISAGDDLYYVDADTPTISKKISGYYAGKALEAVNSGATATIQVAMSAGGGNPGLANISGLQGADLADEAVTLAKMADLARGSIISGQTANNRPTALDAKTSAQILIGDGTDLVSVAVTGDVTITAAGVTAIGAGKVTGAMLATGKIKVDLVSGGAAGAHTVTGMAAGDEIIFVGHISTEASIATLADITGEFTAGTDDANNTGGTDTTNDQLMIIWISKS